MAESAPELHAEIEKLEQKHAEHPEGRYFVPLANAYRKLGEVHRAERLLHEGLRHHPDYLSAHIVLGRCLADRDAVSQAVEEFRYVLTLDAQNLIALRTLGELAAGQGRTAEAEEWYDRLLTVDPMNEEARRALESLRGISGPHADFEPGPGWWERRAEPAPPEAASPEPSDETPPGEPRPESPLADEPAGEALVADAAPGEALLGEDRTDEDRLAGETGATELEVFEPDGLEPFGAAPDAGAAGPSDDDSDWRDLLVLDRPLEEEHEADSDEEVVTETIAELYVRQGFLDHAREVYRTLIRQRGGDPELELRLAELEEETPGAAGAGGAGEAAPQSLEAVEAVELADAGTWSAFAPEPLAESGAGEPVDAFEVIEAGEVIETGAVIEADLEVPPVAEHGLDGRDDLGGAPEPELEPVVADEIEAVAEEGPSAGTDLAAETPTAGEPEPAADAEPEVVSEWPALAADSDTLEGPEGPEEAVGTEPTYADGVDESLVVTHVPSFNDPVWEDSFAESFAEGFPAEEGSQAPPAWPEVEEIALPGEARAVEEPEHRTPPLYGGEEAYPLGAAFPGDSSGTDDPGLGTASGFEPEPARAEPESGPAPAPTVAAFLRGLIGWRPGEPARDAGAPPEPASDRKVGAGAGPSLAGLPEAEPGSAPVEPGTGPAEEDELFPWEIPGTQPASAPEAPPARGGSAHEEAETAAEASFGFEGFDPTPEPSPPAAEPEAGPAATEDEDDDLESFQAWLRSLRR